MLRVVDDGVGPGAAAAGEDQTSFGLRLVHLLARQVRGEFELLARTPGTEARLTVRSLARPEGE